MVTPRTSRTITIAGIAAVALVFAWFVYQRRWISDDGLIDVRVVRQILAGNGPVFNTFERTEANTSALWTWVLVLVAGVTGGNVARVAVITGGVLAVGALVVGMDAARRWHLARGARVPMLPAGALVLLVAWPFRDFGTSGLEGSLCLFWIAACWWLLVLLGPAASRRYVWTYAVVVGLGPLARPDLGLVSAVFMVAGWALLRPPWRRTLALFGAAIALPLAYEVFRAGYYGTLVPLPALAKSATAANWWRGVKYLVNYESPYTLWVPFAVLGALLVGALARRRVIGRDRVVLAAPLVAGALCGLYVTRVGGDFMHGRMWLPASFALLLPALVLPVQKWTAPVLVLLAAWTAYAMTHHQAPRNLKIAEDERIGYVGWTGEPNPDSDAPYVTREGGVVPVIAEVAATGTRRFMSEGGLDVAMAPGVPAPVVFAVGRLGVGGAVVPLDGIVADTLGLANPIGARITPTDPNGWPGHQKTLPWPWLFADFADPATPELPNVPPAELVAARHAMTCGEIAELLAAVREPLTVGRFFSNMAGALRRTRLVIPHDAVEAEAEFCARSDAD